MKGGSELDPANALREVVSTRKEGLSAASSLDENQMGNLPGVDDVDRLAKGSSGES